MDSNDELDDAGMDWLDEGDEEIEEVKADLGAESARERERKVEKEQERAKLQARLEEESAELERKKQLLEQERAKLQVQLEQGKLEDDESKESGNDDPNLLTLHSDEDMLTMKTTASLSPTISQTLNEQQPPKSTSGVYYGQRDLTGVYTGRSYEEAKEEETEKPSPILSDRAQNNPIFPPQPELPPTLSPPKSRPYVNIYEMEADRVTSPVADSPSKNHAAYEYVLQQRKLETENAASEAASIVDELSEIEKEVGVTKVIEGILEGQCACIS